MTRLDFLTTAKKHLPQKVRFVIGMIFIFPLLATLLFVSANARLLLALWDMVKDAYHGCSRGDVTTYVTVRMNE